MKNEDELDFSRENPVSSKRYEWQLSVGQQWLRIDNDHVIETHYCQPGAKGITINTDHGQVYIDYDRMQTLNVSMRVQRLTFLPEGHTEDVGWYFRGDQLWQEYGCQNSSLTSSISSRDIEQQFSLNPEGSFNFTVGSTVYTLDFSAMTQTNCTTGMRRNVRRRPKFSSNAGSFSSTSSSTQFIGGYKWEFMGDEGIWTEFHAHICSFDSAAIERQYQQNPQGQLHFRIKRYSYTLDFSRMEQVNDIIGTVRAVRRTADDWGQQKSSCDAPRWQFQDIDGIWKDYSKGNNNCSTSSQDIELQYQRDPSGTMTFTTRSFSYEINFSAMTQRNLSTNTTRSVQRLDR